MIRNQIRGLLIQDLMIDLGTVNTLIYSSRKGIVLNQPSAIATNRYTGAVIAIGQEAEQMFGQEPYGVLVHHPLKSGMVTDLDLAEKMIKGFLSQVGARWKYTRGLLCISISAPDLECNARREVVCRAGVNRVEFIDGGLAVALGLEAVHEGTTKMVVDIGGGITHFSVISFHGVILSWGLRVAGVAMTEAIIRYVEQKYHLTLSYQTAEDLKIRLGSATEPIDERTLTVIGRSLGDSALQIVAVSAVDVARALESPIQSILNGTRFVLRQAPVEAVHRVCRHGLILTGGGSLMPDLEIRFCNELGIPAHQIENPLEAVALGAGHLADNPHLFRKRTLIQTVGTLKESTRAFSFSRAQPPLPVGQKVHGGEITYVKGKENTMPNGFL